MNDDKIQITLEDFPNDIYIQLEDDFRAEFFKTAWKLNKSYRHLAKKIGVSNTTMLSFRRGKDTVNLDRAISIKRLKDILSHCKESENPIFDINIIQKHVEYIRAKHGMKIYNPRLPIEDSIELREIVTHLLCDGSALIEKQTNSKYALTDLDAVEEFMNKLSIFGNNSDMQILERRYNNHYKTCYVLGFSKAITYILAHKFKIDFRGTKARIPLEFLNGSRDLLCAILRAFLIDEGCIHDRNIIFCSGNLNLLNDLRKICLLLDYKCQNIRNKNNSIFYLYISPDSFERVYRDLKNLKPLSIKDKQQRLDLGYSILTNKPDFSKLNEDIKRVLLSGPTTSVEISKVLFVNSKTIYERLNKMYRRKVINKYRKSNNGRGGSLIWEIKIN